MTNLLKNVLQTSVQAVAKIDLKIRVSQKSKEEFPTKNEMMDDKTVTVTLTMLLRRSVINLTVRNQSAGMTMGL